MRRTTSVGAISGTMNVSIQLDDPLKLNVCQESVMTMQCLKDDSVLSKSK